MSVFGDVHNLVNQYFSSDQAWVKKKKKYAWVNNSFKEQDRPTYFNTKQKKLADTVSRIYTATVLKKIHFSIWHMGSKKNICNHPKSPLKYYFPSNNTCI